MLLLHIFRVVVLHCVMANIIRFYCLIFSSCNSHFIARHEHEQIRLKGNNNNITILLKRLFVTFLPAHEYTNCAAFTVGNAYSGRIYETRE